MQFPALFKKKSADHYDDWIDQDALRVIRSARQAVDDEADPMRRLLSARALIDSIESGRDTQFNLGVPLSEKGRKKIAFRRVGETVTEGTAIVAMPVAGMGGLVGGYVLSFPHLQAILATATTFTAEAAVVMTASLLGGAAVGGLAAVLGGHAVKSSFSTKKINVLPGVRAELNAIVSAMEKVISDVEESLTLDAARRAPDVMANVLAVSPSLKARFGEEATRAVVTGTADDIGLPAKPRAIGRLSQG